MTMLTQISGGLAWGGAIALVHFGGLWFSLTMLPRVARPRMWFYGNYMIRYGLTLGGMWLALKVGPTAVAATCAGFYFTRMIIVPLISGMRE